MSPETMPATPAARKLFVCAKPWDGLYNQWDQSKGFKTFDHIAHVILKRPWSGIIWREGKRKEENFLSSDWLVLDFDAHSMTLEQASKSFSDYQHVIATTKSHTDECHCFRVCIPWESRIIDLDEYNYNVTRNAMFYGSDLRALNGARFFWPSKKIHSVNLDGDYMEVEKPTRKTAPEFEFIRFQRPENREMPSRYHDMVKHGLDHRTTGRNEPLWALCKDFLKEFWDEGEIIELISRIKCNPAYGPDDYAKCLKWAKKSLKKEEIQRKDVKA